MSAGELIVRCFHARTEAHILHLKTRSYAAHKALNDFYDEIVPLADSFAETYIGYYGLIDNFPGKFSQHADAVTMLENLGKWIDENRKDCCDETCLQNIIDEILALIRSTIYKLKFLK